MLTPASIVLTVLLAAPVPALAGDERPRLLVSDLAPQGVEPEVASALTDAVVTVLAERRLFQVMSNKDVQTVLSAERQRQILGTCAEDN